MILKRRSRLVTFRVSSDEYEHVMSACVGVGARSVSEFARLAVLQRIQALDIPQGALSGDLTTLSAALGELDSSLSEIRKKIRGMLGPMKRPDEIDSV